MATKNIVSVTGTLAGPYYAAGPGAIIRCATTGFADELIATRQWIAYDSRIHTSANGFQWITPHVGWYTAVGSTTFTITS